MSEDTAATADGMKQLVIFVLDNEEYGVPITHVKEVVHMVEVTPVPNSPAFIRGVINLRGTVISVIDLESLFGLERDGVRQSGHILVTEDATAALIGVQVDQVTEVLKVPQEVIKPAPALATSKISPDYVSGVLVLDAPDKGSERIILLLDMQQIVSEKLAQAATVSSEDNPPAQERDEIHEHEEHKGKEEV